MAELSTLMFFIRDIEITLIIFIHRQFCFSSSSSCKLKHRVRAWLSNNAFIGNMPSSWGIKSRRTPRSDVSFWYSCNLFAFYAFVYTWFEQIFMQKQATVRSSVLEFLNRLQSIVNCISWREFLTKKAKWATTSFPFNVPFLAPLWHIKLVVAIIIKHD